MGRDIEPGKVEKLLLDLQDWASTTSSVLTALDAKIAAVGDSTATDKARREENEKAFNRNLRDVLEKQKERAKRFPGGGQSLLTPQSVQDMDVDMEPPTAKILRKPAHDSGKAPKRKGRT